MINYQYLVLFSSIFFIVLGIQLKKSGCVSCQDALVVSLGLEIGLEIGLEHGLEHGTRTWDLMCEYQFFSPIPITRLTPTGIYMAIGYSISASM